MATEQDAGRDKLLVIGMGALVIGIVGVAAYLGYGWLHSTEQTPSKIDVSNVASANNQVTAETPAYRNLLEQYNTDGAENARKENQSFIASMAVGVSTPAPPPPKADSNTGQRRTQHQDDRTQSSDHTGQSPALSDEQKASLKALMSRIDNDGDTELGKGVVLAVSKEPGAGSDGSTGRTGSTDAFEQWAGSVTPAVQRDSGSSSRTDAPAIELIPSFTRAPGTITIGVDSDNSNTPVIATIWSGPYSGATFKAPRSQLAGDGVVIHFTTMYWNHQSYTVDAYALKDSTLMANVATNVNHRYWSRILLPAIASGIGKAGQLYQDANTDILTNGYSTVTSHASMPNGTAVGGVIAGGTAADAASVLKQDAARLPPTQATIDAGQPVYIQFMAAVTTADVITPQGSSHTNTTTTLPQQTQTPTLAQLRAQTREQIDSQLHTSQSPQSTESDNE